MPCRATLLKGAFAIALLFGLAGCPIPTSVTFPCNLDAECADDHACVENVCRGGARAPDAGPPRGDAGRTDAGGGRDAGKIPDGGDEPDAGVLPDAGDLDAGIDGGPPIDAGSDGGTALDAGDDGGGDDGGDDAGHDGGEDGDGGDGGDGGSDAGPSLPAPVHHWPFDDPADSPTVTDVVGARHGVAIGATHTGSGGLDFNGVDAYVDLPNGIVSSLQNASFEVWLRWRGPEDDNWARVFDFGTSSIGEVNASTSLSFTGEGSSYLFVTVTNIHTDQTRFGITLNGNAEGAEQVLDAPRIPSDGTLTHIVVAYDGDNDTARLYTNGVLRSSMDVSIDLDQIVDHNNWLGRSNWSVDPFFDGLLEDFRIYDVALTDEQAEATYLAGVP